MVPALEVLVSGIVQIHLMSFQRRHAQESSGCETRSPILLLLEQFACSRKELQPDRKFFGAERLTVDHSRPQVTAGGIDKDARIRRPRPFG